MQQTVLIKPVALAVGLLIAISASAQQQASVDVVNEQAVSTEQASQQVAATESAESSELTSDVELTEASEATAVVAEPGADSNAGQESEAVGEVESVVDADKPLSEQVTDIKQAMIELNRDLFILEEDLLYPASTQVSVFVSMDVGEFFKLDSVQLLIDNKPVTNYLYTRREVKALHRGGVQRLYVGNVKAGEHEITAYFTGLGPQKREYTRGATTTFEKSEDPVLLELKIVDSDAKQQPKFSIKTW